MPLLDPKKFPGLLSGERGKLAIHADWPAYPCGHSWHEALYRLTAFPAGTSFDLLNDLDGAALFAADVPCNKKIADPLHKDHFHIGIWHEDLIELFRSGLIEGAKPATLGEWKSAQQKALKSSIEKMAKKSGLKSKSPRLLTEVEGQTIDVSSLLAPEECEDEDLPDTIKTRCLFPSRRIRTTDRSAPLVETELAKLQPSVLSLMSRRVRGIFETGYFDSTVREACVELEFRIKELSNSAHYGDKLINHVCAVPRGKKSELNSWRVNFRQEVRSLFKMTRNPFMHALKDISRAQCLSLLFRVQRVNSGLV